MIHWIAMCFFVYEEGQVSLPDCGINFGRRLARIINPCKSQTPSSGQRPDLTLLATEYALGNKDLPDWPQGGFSKTAIWKCSSPNANPTTPKLSRSPEIVTSKPKARYAPESHRRRDLAAFFWGRLNRVPGSESLFFSQKVCFSHARIKGGLTQSQAQAYEQS